MKNNKKLNNGCLRIFKFLKLLYEDEAEYNKVLEIFKDEVKEPPKENIQVSLNRYINTLKVFGIKLKKENTKYKLQSSLYEINFTESDLRAISILVNYITNFPDNKLVMPMQDFLQKIELRMNSNDKNTLNTIINENSYDFEFYYSNVRDQIVQCEKLCREKFIITILYNKNNESLQCRGLLKEVIYGCKNISIMVYDFGSHTNIEIPIQNILSIVPSPRMSSSTAGTTVVYKLKNRLAKSYKLKENEYLQDYTEEGDILVVNKDESFESLLHRLLRYTYNCEIISPKNYRDAMIKLLDETINNYEQE